MLLFNLVFLVIFLSIVYREFATRPFVLRRPGPRKFFVPWNAGHIAAVFIFYILVSPQVVGALLGPSIERFYPQLEKKQTTSIESDTVDNQNVANNDAKDGAREDVATDSVENNEVANESKSGDANGSYADDIDRIKSAIDERGLAPTEDDVDSSQPFSDYKVIETIDLSNGETSGAENADDPTAQNATKPANESTMHPVARLMLRARHSKYYWVVVALVFLSVVLIAPLTEEFIFRVLIQGYLEKIFPPVLRVKSDSRDAERDVLVARLKNALAVSAIQAGLFALMHVGVPESPDAPTPLVDLFRSTVVSSVSLVLTLVVGLVFIVKLCGATSENLGLQSETPRDADIGKKAFDKLQEWTRGVYILVYISPIVFGVNLLLANLVPNFVVAPAPIFIFSFFEGLVYYRTRSYFTVVGMHMALNFASFSLLFFGVLRGLV